MPGWSAADIPDQCGRTVVITGASSGLGLESTRALAARGATVVMACRDLEKAQAVRSGLGLPAERTEVLVLDLGDLGSVHRFAEQLAGRRIDVLVNNAGVMMQPYARTASGVEQHWAVNVLGPFLLTGLLLPQVTDRVVWLASQMHRIGAFDLDDPQFERRRYVGFRSYGQSKLADLMLGYELQRRLTAAGSGVRSIAAHPGYSATSLLVRPEHGRFGALMTRANAISWVASDPASGALPQLYAATAPEAMGGSYVGPHGRFEAAGPPGTVGARRLAHDRDAARALWALCERQTGRSFVVRPGSRATHR